MSPSTPSGMSERHHGSSRAGLAQVSLAGVLWGTGGLAVLLVRHRESLSTLMISAYRTAIAAVVLLASVALVRRGRAVLRLATEQPIRIATVGVLTATYQALYFAAVIAVGVAVSTVVSLGIAPVLLAVAEALRGRTMPSRARIGTLAAALAGLVLVTFGGTTGGGAHHHAALGVLAALGSGTAYAATTALGAPLARRADPLVLTTATTTIGAFALIPVSVVVLAVVGGPAVPHTLGVVALLCYLGAVTMALAYGLLYAGLRTTSGSAAVIATLLEPVTAAVAAAVFLGERLSPLALVGGVLILGAVASLTGRDR